MLLPAIGLTQTIETCAEWWECPYRSPSEEPNYRYVSLNDLQLPFAWREIEIEGNKAMVCLAEPMPEGDSAGCTRLNRGQVRGARMRPPFTPYFDTATNMIKFHADRPRKFNVDGILRGIKDTTLDETLLKDRNEGR